MPDNSGSPFIDENVSGERAHALLMRSLLARYTDIKARLTRKLGPDIAAEALQETWIRLQDRKDIAPVANPDAYLFRAALNTGHNLRIAHDRLLTFTEVELLLAVPDDAPGPDLIAQDRADIALVQAALRELSERQREVFLESFLGDQPQTMLAERYGVSLRTIQKDLRRAVEHCARRLGRKKSFATGQPKLSLSRGDDA
ncbi:MAG: RNA polymerase sigma factor [Sphingobium sp.]|uniref:RNA polymerase sigma factor n=1 Tax=Sphingobium sp. CECT 9361 TaxID=2845384 RepID=UPI001E51052B|nr:RNA polymerase sigma factor [Sphingobium sp. CECT 9361]CAH0348286.1 hypothetical protein SPH9361_00023 [Sphingobium sp. CECT 9361]